MLQLGSCEEGVGVERGGHGPGACVNACHQIDAASMTFDGLHSQKKKKDDIDGLLSTSR